MRIRWTEPAATALGKIQDYIASENPRAAFEVAQRIRIAVSQLQEHPRVGRPGRVRGTYELVIHDLPYVVPYRIKNEEVQILSVYHTSRKWPETFQ
ncbi:MAG: type II toxin-antitoxin system RelE/ParE family toxin [Gammaproteobacteria bacterium]|nr:type II toxin-antitoxin system RelE/ParE family toxin [Gammaproteobacteria bacterium]